MAYRFRNRKKSRVPDGSCLKWISGRDKVAAVLEDGEFRRNVRLFHTTGEVLNVSDPQVGDKRIGTVQRSKATAALRSQLVDDAARLPLASAGQRL